MEVAKQLTHARLKLLLSVDLVGSTAFKQANQHSKDWFEATAVFYTNFQKYLNTEWIRCSRPSMPSFQKRHYGEPFLFWKAVGDELLYSKEITYYKQVATCLSVWRNALADIRGDIRKFKQLDVKSTAWMANFPIANREIPLPIDRSMPLPSSYVEQLDNYFQDQKKYNADFVGPSVDTGFRLSQHATSRKLVLSLGVVWMLTEALKAPTETPHVGSQNDWPIHFDGRVELRGVLGAPRYPLFWVDMRDKSDKTVAEDGLLAETAIRHPLIVEFCKAEIENRKPHLFPPYIDANEVPDPSIYDPFVMTSAHPHKIKIEEEWIGGKVSEYKITRR